MDESLGPPVTARIYVDVEAIHPVVDGRWHHARGLARVPDPGEPVTMLCGLTAPAEFEPADRRRTLRTPTCCWSCDLVYRRQHGIGVWPGHPALVPSPVPRSR